MSVATDRPRLEQPDPAETAHPPARHHSAYRRGRSRFVRAVVIGQVVVGVPYLWVLTSLWTGSFNLLRPLSPDNFYDLQARAMFAGHLYVPNGSLGIEAFVHGGRQYTYFGIFPSLVRMPVLAFTHSFDGRLTAPSMLLAWVVTGVFSSLLLWRVRLMVRGRDIMGRAEAVGCGVLVAAVTGGSVLVYLAASPKVTSEDLAWSVALTIGAVFALLGVVERASWGRVVTSGVLVLATNLDRSPTGYACDIAALLIAAWFALGKGGPDQRRWFVPMVVVGLVPTAVAAAVNMAKLGSPFGLSEADQVWTQVNAHRRAFLAANGGSTFGLKFLPSTLTAYLRPDGFHLQSVFPYLTLPTGPAVAVGNVLLDETYPTASLPASMPLLFLAGCWGLITAFRPRPVGRVGVMRLLLVATALGTAGVLLIGYIADRYLADFLPFLVLAAMIGLVDVWSRMDGRSRRWRAVTLGVVTVLALLGIWANFGAAVAPTSLWTPAQALRYVNAERALGGGALGSVVEHGPSLPTFAPSGTIFAVGDCSGLYVSTGISYSTVPGQQLEHLTWIPVEQGPGINHTMTVEFNRTVRAGDRPVVLLTYGPSSLVLEPTGTDRVRFVVEHAGAPSVHWPPTSTASVPVVPHTVYGVVAMTDPNMKEILAGGMGVGVEHYLAGDGPAVVVTTPASSGNDAGPVTVTDISPAPSSMSLCRSLVPAASR
jgi:hypothetical protein